MRERLSEIRKQMVKRENALDDLLEGLKELPLEGAQVFVRRVNKKITNIMEQKKNLKRWATEETDI